jgi:hypothetical protein
MCAQRLHLISTIDKGGQQFTQIDRAASGRHVCQITSLESESLDVRTRALDVGEDPRRKDLGAQPTHTGHYRGLRARGARIASASPGCARTLNQGDVLICYEMRAISFWSLPDLKKLSEIVDRSNAEIHVVNDHWIGQAGYEFNGYTD